MPKKIKTLIVAADAQELKFLADLGHRHSVIIDEIGYLSAGIGPVAATFGLTHFLEDYRPERILAIGTAGFFDPDRFAIGDLITATSVSTVGRDVPLSAAKEPSTYTPEVQPNNIVFPAHASDPVKRGSSDWVPAPDCPSGIKAGMTKILQSAKPARVFAPQEISRAPEWQKHLATHYDVEHLESFAYAFVAQKFKIPLQIVLGLVNEVGPNAHAQWRTNADQVMNELSSVIKNS